MCNTTPLSVYDEDTEIDSEIETEVEQDQDDLNGDKQVRDIYKKKDLPYRKQYCPFDGCSAYFFVHWHLERHIRKHKGEKPFICTHDDCDKAFTCRSYLNKHVKQAHERPKKPRRERKVYPCPECDHVFKQKYNLKVHLCQHTGEKPFHCGQCEKSYTSATRLRKHAKVHAGYRCVREGCTFVASKWTELQKHVAAEHKEEHECSVCQRKFNERYALTRHLKIHSGERLTCSYENCGRTYTNKRNLKAHIRIDHEGVKFTCERCSKTFKYKCSLTKHIVKAHRTPKSAEQVKKPPIVYSHRVSYAEKLTGVQCCEEELKRIMLDDKNYRMQIAAN